MTNKRRYRAKKIVKKFFPLLGLPVELQEAIFHSGVLDLGDFRNLHLTCKGFRFVKYYGVSVVVKESMPSLSNFKCCRFSGVSSDLVHEIPKDCFVTQLSINTRFFNIPDVRNLEIFKHLEVVHISKTGTSLFVNRRTVSTTSDEHFSICSQLLRKGYIKGATRTKPFLSFRDTKTRILPGSTRISISIVDVFDYGDLAGLRHIYWSDEFPRSFQHFKFDYLLENKEWKTMILPLSHDQVILAVNTLPKLKRIGYTDDSSIPLIMERGIHGKKFGGYPTGSTGKIRSWLKMAPRTCMTSCDLRINEPSRVHNDTDSASAEVPSICQTRPVREQDLVGESIIRGRDLARRYERGRK